MIIDVTREFNDEEYSAYIDLIQRYDEKWWLIKDGEGAWYDSPDYDGEYHYEPPSDVMDMTTWEEEDFLEELSKRVKKCVEKFRREGWTVIEKLVDYHMILWLDRQEISYFVIHDPMAFDYFWLAIKDEHAYKIFNAKFRHNIDEKYFMGKGWIRLDDPITSEMLIWCYDNLGDDFIRGMNKSYFTEEAYMMYKLRWL